MTAPRDPLAEALLNALKANTYRGAWNSDRDTMQPLAWDADDVIDRIIEDAALRAGLAPRPPETADPLADLLNDIEQSGIHHVPVQYDAGCAQHGGTTERHCAADGHPMPETADAGALDALKWWVLADIAHERNESIADVGGHCNHDESPPECIREAQGTAKAYNERVGRDATPALDVERHRPVLRSANHRGDLQVECACGWLWTDGDDDDPEGSAFMRHALRAAESPTPEPDA